MDELSGSASRSPEPKTTWRDWKLPRIRSQNLVTLVCLPLICILLFISIFSSNRQSFSFDFNFPESPAHDHHDSKSRYKVLPELGKPNDSRLKIPLGKGVDFVPSIIPLAVRTPYLSTWATKGDGRSIAEPMFWNGKTTGWSGAVRVDGTTYFWMGDPGYYATRAVQTNFQLTSTQTRYTFACGPIDLFVDFLSPIEAKNLTTQSIPLSYLALEVVSTDGKEHSVQIYSDVTAEWTTTDHERHVTWDLRKTSETIYHSISLSEEYLYSEADDSALWGDVIYGTQIRKGLTHMSGPASLIRSTFALSGGLYNLTDPLKNRKISEDRPTFGFAVDLGTVKPGLIEEPLVFAIGHVRQPAIQWTALGFKGKKADRNLYAISAFDGRVDSMLECFLSQFHPSLEYANKLDIEIEDKAKSLVSQDYASICALSARQAMATIEITVGRSHSQGGSWNMSDVLVFMKEISSDGNLNTVDVIFPFAPILLYLNPELFGNLLDPHLLYASSGRYPHLYSGHDLGSSYPNATGHNDGNDESMPVEESGNMILLMLVHALVTDDSSRLIKYQSLLRQWAEFLIRDGLIPEHQLSTDDFAGPLANQTNLALKAIVAIGAMEKISDLVGDRSGAEYYKKTAGNYIKSWQKLALSSSGSHLKLAYQDDNSWGLIYNAYFDKLLGLDLVPQEIISMQSEWYEKMANPFGVPLDSRHQYTKSDWLLWTAAFMPTIKSRDFFISGMVRYLQGTGYNRPLPDWFETQDGRSDGFANRPVVGGHFSFFLFDIFGKANSLPSNNNVKEEPESSRWQTVFKVEK